MPRIPVDPDTHIVETCYDVIHGPRRARGRFAADCVSIVEDEADARAQAQAAVHRHAAVVMGPSRSSEGVMLYYLVRWLD